MISLVVRSRLSLVSYLLLVCHRLWLVVCDITGNTDTKLQHIKAD